MKKIYLILLLCCPIVASAQQISPPDFAKIKLTVNDPSNALYYPKLFEKFEAADSAMTLREKRHLYYGFSHQKNYSPYSRSDYLDSLNIVLKIKKPSKKEFKKLIVYADSLLADNPFDLNAYSYKSYAYSHLKEDDLGRKIFTQKRIIAEAMQSSGDGLTKNTAFYVISPGHQHFMLKLLDLKFNGSQSVIDDFEYLSVETNAAEIDGIFFDVSAISNHMSNLFKQEP